MRINLANRSTELKADHATVIVDAEMIFTDKAKATQDHGGANASSLILCFNPKKAGRFSRLLPGSFLSSRSPLGLEKPGL